MIDALLPVLFFVAYFLPFAGQPICFFLLPERYRMGPMHGRCTGIWFIALAVIVFSASLYWDL